LFTTLIALALTAVCSVKASAGGMGTTQEQGQSVTAQSPAVAIEDAITAATVYEKAQATHIGDYVDFAA